MSQLDRRGAYRWPKTMLSDISVVSDKAKFALDEVVGVSLSFRVIGGLRESFNPDVWTLAWEDNDKLVRLMMECSVSSGKKLADTGKVVRKAKFYWSRDPDLPYRIWAAVVHEEGGGPIIPAGVEDARSKFLDVAKRLEFPAKSLGRGTHRLVGGVKVSWGRRTYLEKGTASGKTKPVAIKVE